MRNGDGNEKKKDANAGKPIGKMGIKPLEELPAITQRSQRRVKGVNRGRWKKGGYRGVIGEEGVRVGPYTFKCRENTPDKAVLEIREEMPDMETGNVLVGVVVCKEGKERSIDIGPDNIKITTKAIGERGPVVEIIAEEKKD